MDLNSKEIAFAELEKLFDINRNKIDGALIQLRWYFAPEDITNVHVLSFLLAKYHLAEDEHLKKLSGKTSNALKRAGITAFEQLCGKTEEELIEIRGFGQAMLEEVREFLAKERTEA